jgi:signal transduction histidine kinase
MLFKRNAKRLQKLTEDILDVTKIESQSLKFNKEQFELKQTITDKTSITTAIQKEKHKKRIFMLFIVTVLVFFKKLTSTFVNKWNYFFHHNLMKIVCSYVKSQ